MGTSGENSERTAAAQRAIRKVKPRVYVEGANPSHYSVRDVNALMNAGVVVVDGMQVEVISGRDGTVRSEVFGPSGIREKIITFPGYTAGVQESLTDSINRIARRTRTAQSYK